MTAKFKVGDEIYWNNPGNNSPQSQPAFFPSCIIICVTRRSGYYDYDVVNRYNGLTDSFTNDSIFEIVIKKPVTDWRKRMKR